MLTCLVLTFLGAAPPEEPRIGDERIAVETDHGTIVLGLYPDVAPKHVAQILALVRAKAYDGTHFHRIEPGFVAQVSNADDRTPPLSKSQRALIGPIEDEFSKLEHRRFRLSMAKWPEPNSAETSFSILLGRGVHLDGKFTVFGEVLHGQDVVARLEKVAVRGSAPVERLRVRRMTVVEKR